MKRATYQDEKGNPFEIEYDEDAPCISCGLPVVEASVGGTVVCPWCDCGHYRDGSEWTFHEAVNKELRQAKAKDIYDRLISGGALS